MRVGVKAFARLIQRPRPRGLTLQSASRVEPGGNALRSAAAWGRCAVGGI
jgi:hypothetical protein